MKSSPIQLLQSTIEKLSVEANDSYDGEDPNSLGEKLDLQVKEICEPFADFWEDQKPATKELANRTFLVRLAIRTDPEGDAKAPYAFELVFSGVVACMPPKLNHFSPEQAARQYGFAMVYGAMREQFLTVTSRMPHGPRLLPTVSFMEPDPKPLAPTDKEAFRTERARLTSEPKPARKRATVPKATPSRRSRG